MKAIDYVKQHSEYELGYMLRHSFFSGFLAATHEQEIAKFHESFPDRCLNITSSEIGISNATRPELIAFLTSFGGNWIKEVEEYYPDKMRYIQNREVDSHKYTLKAGCVPPPPSCKIVNEEVTIPEHKEIKMKIVCKEPATDPVEELEAAVEEANANELGPQS